MTKSFSLQAVLEVMQKRADDATRRLAELLAAERDAKVKLGMLQQYRDEYAERLRQAAQTGVSQREWRNFHDFLGRLDEAIAQQGQAVGASERHTVAGQADWQQQRTKLKAIDTLSQRHRTQEMASELKREQKIQDDFASRKGNDDG